MVLLVAKCYRKFCIFFKCLLNFRAHALQSELNKVGYTIFVKFGLQSYNIERAFEKMTQHVFIFFLPIPTLTSYFPHILINFLKIFYILKLH